MIDTDSLTANDASPPVLRPAEVAERLGISAATLRRWSSRFGDFLEFGDGNQDGGTHRRYTPADVETLARVQKLLEQGWTYEQVADRLRLEPADSGVDAATEEPAAHAAAPAEADRVTATAIVAANAMFQENADLATDELPPAARFLRDTMQTVASTQQVILNSQQASRDMLGVMIQDNLNLKGENTNLRERMLELERELAEIQRHFVDTRERTEIRMRVLEDAIAKLMAGQHASASRPPTSRPNPTPQTPPGYPPSGYPAQGTAQPSYPPASTAQPAYPPSGQAPQPYPPVGYAPQPATPSAYPPPYPDQQPPPPKRGFWARLLGG